MSKDANGTNVTVNEANEKVVQIVPGAGQKPITVPWREGLTYQQALDAANVKLQKGEVLVVGEVALKNLKKVMQPGQMAVVDHAPSNGKIPA